jgi:alkaline phosphatase
MSLAVTPDGRDSFYGAMSRQRGSYSVFERTVGSGGSDDISKARNFFGDGVSATDTVQRALRLSKTAKKNRPAGSAEYKKLYGPYDPFTIACMREMNARAGVTWSTFYHTGKRVPVSAAGAGSEAFAGEYENTEIFTKLLEAMRRER